MYSQIKRLRHRGALLESAEISGDSGVFGDLRLRWDGKHSYMGLYEWDNPIAIASLVPMLIDPVLTGLTHDLIRLSGWERLGDECDSAACTVMQEWSVKCLLRPGKEMPKTGFHENGWIAMGESKPDDFLPGPGAID
jgi:hypothetical protein